MLIGILGEAGSGKDTAGRILVQEHGFYSLALADPIKVYCSWMFGWDAPRLFASSELRNEPDEDYPFLRCPSCGYTAHGIEEAIDMNANSVECEVCHGIRVPAEWTGNLSARYALQSLGDWSRALYKDAYIAFALHRAVKVQNCGLDCDPLYASLRALKVIRSRSLHVSSHSTCDHVLISDVRLKNEVAGIKAEGGRVYRIRRRGSQDNTTTGIPQHNSEMEQREIADEELDGIIENHGTLDALRERLGSIVQPQS
jgi:hypothetical protein